jgi:adenylate kinase family enzyme
VSRILIAGVPRSGKTTLSARLAAESPGTRVLHTDDLIATHDWSAASAQAALWMEGDDFIAEGVAIPRALRKFFAAHPAWSPAGVVYWLGVPYETLTKGQAAMARGCETVWAEVVGELMRRGVVIRTAP